MILKRLKQTTIALLVLLPAGLLAQESTNTSGGIAEGNGGTSSYSVGQVAYTMNTGSEGTVTHGVQQPYEISVATGYEQVKGIDLTIKAYPNPATDYLTLYIEDHQQPSLRYQLFDMSGRLLQTNYIHNRETIINMSKCVPSIYFLKVNGEKGTIISFKIIKQ